MPTRKWRFPDDALIPPKTYNIHFFDSPDDTLKVNMIEKKQKNGEEKPFIAYIERNILSTKPEMNETEHLISSRVACFVIGMLWKTFKRSEFLDFHELFGGIAH